MAPAPWPRAPRPYTQGHPSAAAVVCDSGAGGQRLGIVAVRASCVVRGCALDSGEGALCRVQPPFLLGAEGLVGRLVHEAVELGGVRELDLVRVGVSGLGVGARVG